MKSRKLVVFISTSQSPHFEAMIKYAYDSIGLYKKIYVINLLPRLRYRHEISYRSYLPVSLNLSRLIRNGINKQLFFLFKKRKKSPIEHINFSKTLQGDKIIGEEDAYSILKTYSCTEWKAAALRVNRYTLKIRRDIDSISKKISTLFFDLNLDNECDFLIFNGRLPIENTIVTSLTKIGCKNFIYHECNNYQNKVFFTRNRIHDLPSYYEEIYQYYENNREKLLENYFKYKKISRKDVELKENIFTYFTNSAEEYQFAYKIPINQSKIIARLLEVDFRNFSLKIRVHPGTKNKPKEVRSYWDRLKLLYPEIIINYDENVSSYELCKKSKLTASMGSSMAAESLILKTPHALIGKQNWYYNFPGYILCSESNFIEVITKFLSVTLTGENLEVSIKERQLAAASILFRFKKGARINCVPFGKFPVSEAPLNFLD
jgi:hypothetical protein